MPKKKLTADVAREVAEAIEDGVVESLVIRPRLSGKNKGELFAEWKTGEDVNITIPDHANVKLIEILHDVASKVERGANVEVTINRDLQNQLISYTRGV